MNQSMRSKKYVGVWGVFLAALLYTLVTDAAAQPDNAKEGENSEDWVKLYEPNVYNEMPYRLMKPIDFDPKKRYPIIVSLHGGAGRGTDNRKQLRPWTRPLAEEQMRTDYPSYVLAPQVSRMWDAENLQKIKDLVAELPSVDMDRIYALGHSMGGHGIHLFLQIDPSYFVAVSPSAGSGRPTSEEFIDAAVIQDVPMWAFPGDQDEVSPIGRELKLFAEMQELGGNMKLTIWTGDGHGVATKMVTGADNGSTQLSSDRCDPEPVFMKWLFAQKRNLD